jgi:hypothetical protein
MFDPHTRFLPGSTLNQPGIKLKFVKSDFSEQFPDQFNPYKMFGCDFKEHFNGTLFRFPLRTEEMGKSSEVKSTPCRPSDMFELLETFKSSIAESLLFLKNVREIEVYVQREPCPDVEPRDTCPAPELVYCAKVEDRNVQEWSTIANFFKDTAPSGAASKKELGKDTMYLKLASTPTPSLPRVSQVVAIAYAEHCLLTGGAGEQQLPKWLDTFIVACGIAGGRARDMACDEKYRELKMLPVGGVAAHLSRDAGLDASALEEIGHVVAGGNGKAFCTLPLPVYVGLPVHINAYFELSSNRRDIWFGDDMAGEGRRKSEWNLILLQNVVCGEYLRMLQLAKTLVATQADIDRSNGEGVTIERRRQLLAAVQPERHSSSPQVQCTLQQYYDLWPSSSPRLPWSNVVEGTLSKVRDLPLLFSKVLNSWVCPKDAILLRDGSVECLGFLWDFFEAERVPVVVLSDPLYSFLVSDKIKPFVGAQGNVTPAFVRGILKNATGLCRQRLEDSHDMAIALLEYCLSDLSLETMVGSNSNWHAQLIDGLSGLPLLPLKDGSLGCFRAFPKSRLDTDTNPSHPAATANSVGIVRSYVGEKWVIGGLTSAKGRTLNGKVGECVRFTGEGGKPGMKLHLQIPGEPLMQFHFANVKPVDLPPQLPPRTQIETKAPQKGPTAVEHGPYYFTEDRREVVLLQKLSGKIVDVARLSESTAAVLRKCCQLQDGSSSEVNGVVSVKGAAAADSRLNMSCMTPFIFVSLIQKMIPSNWKGRAEIPSRMLHAIDNDNDKDNDNASNSSAPPSLPSSMGLLWYKLLWTHMHENRIVEHFEEGMPLLPALTVGAGVGSSSDGGGVSVGGSFVLIPLKKDNGIILGECLHANVVSLILKLGGKVFVPSMLDWEAMPSTLQPYISSPDFAGILGTLERCFEAHAAAAVPASSTLSYSSLFDQKRVNGEEKSSLRSLLFGYVAATEGASAAPSTVQQSSGSGTSTSFKRMMPSVSMSSSRSGGGDSSSGSVSAQEHSVSHMEIELLKKLPIFQVHVCGGNDDADVGDACFVSILNTTRLLALPPRDLPVSKLVFQSPTSLDTDDGDRKQSKWPLFIKCMQFSENNIYESMLGVAPLKAAQYFADFFLPHASEIYKSELQENTNDNVNANESEGCRNTPSFYNDCVWHILRHIEEFNMDRPGFMDIFKNSKSIPTFDPNQTNAKIPREMSLFKPIELYDPLEPGLIEILGDDFFPAQSYQELPDIIERLRSLGLKQNVTREGIIAAAVSISLLVSDDPEAAQSRAMNLITFMNGHFDLIPYSTSRQSISRLGQFFAQPGSAGKKSTDGIMDAQSQKNAGAVQREVEELAFAEKLKNIAFLPVHDINFKTKLGEVGKFLPWNEEESQGISFARPSEVRSENDAWMCSFALRIYKPVNDMHISEPWQRCFGWDDYLPCNVLAHQLVRIATIHGDSALSAAASVSKQTDEMASSSSITTAPAVHVASAAASFQLNLLKLLPRLYEQLHCRLEIVQSKLASVQDATYDDEHLRVQFEKERSEATRLLHSSENNWIWVGDMFAKSASVSFSGAPDNARPFIHSVPHDLGLFKDTLHYFGVKEAFPPSTYTQVLWMLPPSPERLSDAQISLAVLLLNRLCIRGDESNPSESTEDLRLLDGITHRDILVPSADGTLRNADELVFDDAPWLSSREQDRLLFCHSTVPNDVASCVGVRSLRQSLLQDESNSTTRAYNSHNEVHNLMDSWPHPEMAMLDFLELADASLTCGHVQIALDKRVLPSQSLLHPCLSDAQKDDSVCIRLPGVHLGLQDIVSLSTPIVDPGKLNRVTQRSGHFGPSEKAGWCSLFHLTDCLQVRRMQFDPFMLREGVVG